MKIFRHTGKTMASRLSITIIGVLFAATTAASLAAQDLYVGDFGKAKILKISPEGAVEIYAAPITAPNQMAFDASGNLYVAGGTAIWKIAPPQGGAAPVVSKIFEGDPLRNARALTIDPDGNFWVSKYHNGQIPDTNPAEYYPGALYKVTPSGVLSTIESEIVYPYGLATGPDGRVYLAQLAGNQLWSYKKDGTDKRLEDSGSGWLHNIIFDATDKIIAMNGDFIEEIDANRNVLPFFEFASDTYGARHPIGLAFDDAGILYSSDWATNTNDTGKIFRYSPDGTSRELWCATGSNPSYMAFYPSAYGTRTKWNGVAGASITVNTNWTAKVPTAANGASAAQRGRIKTSSNIFWGANLSGYFVTQTEGTLSSSNANRSLIGTDWAMTGGALTTGSGSLALNNALLDISGNATVAANVFKTQNACSEIVVRGGSLTASALQLNMSYDLFEQIGGDVIVGGNIKIQQGATAILVGGTCSAGSLTLDSGGLVKLAYGNAEVEFGSAAISGKVDFTYDSAALLTILSYQSSNYQALWDANRLTIDGSTKADLGNIPFSESQFIVEDNTIWRATAAGVPYTPTGLSATVNGTTITLSWNDVSINETGFTILRSTSSDFSGATWLSSRINTTTRTDANLASNTYYYQIRANGEDGNSAFSSPITVTVGGIPSELIVSDFSGTAPALNTPWISGSVATGLTFSGWVTGSGATPYATNNVFAYKAYGTAAADGSTLSEAFTQNSYTGFTVTPNAGNALNLNGGEFEVTLTRDNYNDARYYALCTSVGGFSQSNVIATASFVARGTAGYGTITFSLVLPSTGYDSLTGSVEFRLYAYGAKYSQPVEMSTFELRSDGGY